MEHFGQQRGPVALEEGVAQHEQGGEDAEGYGEGYGEGVCRGGGGLLLFLGGAWGGCCGGCGGGAGGVGHAAEDEDLRAWEADGGCADAGEGVVCCGAGEGCGDGEKGGGGVAVGREIGGEDGPGEGACVGVE